MFYSGGPIPKIFDVANTSRANDTRFYGEITMVIFDKHFITLAIPFSGLMWFASLCGNIDRLKIGTHSI